MLNSNYVSNRENTNYLNIKPMRLEIEIIKKTSSVQMQCDLQFFFFFFEKRTALCISDKLFQFQHQNGVLLSRNLKAGIFFFEGQIKVFCLNSLTLMAL